jgi:hypothetical protein
MDVCTVIRRLQLHSAHGDGDPDEVAAALAEMLTTLDEDSRRAVVRHAYWRMPDVPTGALQRALGDDMTLRALAGRGPAVGTCRRCGRVVRARDRDGADELGDAAQVCTTCATVPPAVGGSRRSPHRATAWEFEGTPSVSALRDGSGDPAGAPTDGVGSVAMRRWAEHYPAR